MAQVKSSTFLNHGPLRSGTGRSTIGPRPPPNFGTPKPSSRRIFNNAGSSSSSSSLSSTVTSSALSNSSNTLESTIRNLRLAERPAPRTPSPILESMGEPRTPPSEPILESMGDDGIMAPPSMIHAPQPHYYNTVNGPLAYHAQQGPAPSWPNHGYATLNAPPAGYGTVGSHHGHAHAHPSQQNYYSQHQQPSWPQDPYQQQQQQHQHFHEYVQQQNIATAAAHGYQLVSAAPTASVIQQHAPVAVAVPPSTIAPTPHHASVPQMIPPIPVDTPQYKPHFPPKTDFPSTEHIVAHSPPTPAFSTPEQRQRPPSPRITIPANQSTTPPPPSSSQTSAYTTTPATPASLPSASSIATASSSVPAKIHAQSGPSTPSPRSSTPTSSVSKLSDRLANFSSNKTNMGTTSRLSEMATTLGSARARPIKPSTASSTAAATTMEPPAVQSPGYQARSLPSIPSNSPKAPSSSRMAASSSPKATSPSMMSASNSPKVTHSSMTSASNSPKVSSPSMMASSMIVDTPNDLLISPPETTASEECPLERASLSMYSVPTTEASASTTSLDSRVSATPSIESTAKSSPVLAATITATTTAPSTLIDNNKSGSGARPDSARSFALGEKDTAVTTAAPTKRPVSTGGPPVPPPRGGGGGGGGGTYDWRSEWADRRKSTPVSPYSPSFNALRKLNMDKELPPIRAVGQQQQQQLSPPLPQQQEPEQPPRTLASKLDPYARYSSPKLEGMDASTTLSAKATTTTSTATVSGPRGMTPRMATPPINSPVLQATNVTHAATPRVNTPPLAPPPSSSRGAAAAVPPDHLRVPTPPVPVPPVVVEPVEAAAGPAPAPREERRAYNLSDYIYYDHDHDSKCIVESTDAYPEATTAAVSRDVGKVPLEHASQEVEEEEEEGEEQERGMARAQQPLGKNARHHHHGSKQAAQQQKMTAAESNFVCAGCEQPISGMMVTAMGRRWHVDHFICVECGQNLEHVQFFQRDGHPYCHYDYHEKYSPRCAHCDTAIENECLTALGKSWHPEHFFCRSCGDPFGEDGYMIHEDRPYCEKDYLRLFAPKCAGCQDAIQGDFINALKRKWHRDCFGCTVCHIGFDHSSYFVRDGEPYCETHYKAVKSADLAP